MLGSISEFGLVRTLGAILCGLFVLAASFFSTLWLLDRYNSPAPQPFELGTQVTSSGGAAKLAANGREIQLVHSKPGDKLAGAAENLSAESDGSFKATGWAVSPEEKAPAQYVVAISNGKLVAWGEPTVPRTDIAAGVGATYARSGFVLPIPKLTPSQIKSLEVYAVSRAGVGHELNYSSAFR